MDTNQTDGGAVNTEGSANGGGNGQQQETQQPRMVSYEDHQRALNDLHRFKDASKKNADQVAAMQSQLDEMNRKLASQTKDYETLYTTEKQKREAIEGEKTKLLTNVINSERYRAAYPALKKAGLRDDAENLLEVLALDPIDVEATSTGRFVCSGVETFVETVRTKYPYAFAKATTPVVNGTSGNGTAGASEAWSPAKLVALEAKCRKEGNLGPYKLAVEEWRKQGKPN